MTTRLALIADIHGNGPALRAVLDAIDATPGIERIFCLGDVVSIGPDVNEVVGMLAARTDVSLVRGNHEGYVLAALRGEEMPPEVGAGEIEHQKWMAARLDAAFVPFLAALPERLEAEYEGCRLWFLHYHCDPESPGRFVTWWPELDRLEQHYASAPVDVVCFGHIHPTQLLRGAGKIYVDPGSVGCTERPAARYAVLTIDQGRVTVDLCEAHYDSGEFFASYDRLGVPDRDFIRLAFHGNQHQGR